MNNTDYLTTTDDYTIRWRSLVSGDATTFSNLSTVTGSITGVAIDALPSGHQKMRGLQTAIWSGYADTSHIAAGFTGIGELVLIRHDHDKSKAYCYPIGQSGDTIRIGAEFKYFDGHHSSTGSPAPLSMLFGNIPWPEPSINATGNA